MVTTLVPLGSHVSIIDTESICRKKQATTSFLKGTKGRISNKFTKKMTLRDRNLGNSIII
jgi:hypothetical protein